MARRSRAFLYLRVSVDKEDGNNLSIEAQRHALHDYCERNGIDIVEEFADVGISGATLNRPGFRQMLGRATSSERPVDLVLVFALSRAARRLRDFVNSIDALETAGVEFVSITEGFSADIAGRMARNVTAVFAEHNALETAKNTRKNRRANALNGFWNGGQVPFGYRTFAARVDKQKERMKLRIHEDEARIVRDIYAWSEQGLGHREIAKRLNERGDTIQGRRFCNSNVAGILRRPHYVGYYFDRTADDFGRAPDEEDWIRVECPAIVPVEQAERAAAVRASRNPKANPPHFSAGTTLLGGIATCGVTGCGAGMTIRTGKGGRYAYYTCNAKVNGGERCSCPNVRRERLDDVVLTILERQILERNRLESLLAQILEMSDEANERRRSALAKAKAEQTRVRTGIKNLLKLIEEGVMSPRDPDFAERLAENRSLLDVLNTRIDSLEKQLATGSRRITPEIVGRFGDLVRKALRSDDPKLRTGYVKLLVDRVTVNESEIVVRGSKAALEYGVIRQSPRQEGLVPIFDREWCRLGDSNPRPHHYE